MLVRAILQCEVSAPISLTLIAWLGNGQKALCRYCCESESGWEDTVAEKWCYFAGVDGFGSDDMWLDFFPGLLTQSNA